jgi:uncharacterized protein YxjI
VASGPYADRRLDSPSPTTPERHDVDTATLQGQQTLHMKQRITLMVNQYEIHDSDANGAPSNLIAFAQQKRMALKEQVTLYTDSTKQAVVAGFKARQVIDLGATYDITDSSGASIGTFRKDFAKSLLQSTWHFEQPSIGTITGKERSLAVALLRRFVVSWLPYHFDFVRNGQIAFSVNRKFSLRDRYVISINDPELDRRAVIAMAVALDALQAR